MYTTDYIFTFLPIKHLINKYVELNTRYKLKTGTKPSVSNLSVLLFPCVAQKVTTHVDTKVLNMRHHSHKGFQSIFVEIQQHKKGYLIYVPSTRKIVSSHDILCGKTLFRELTYMSHPYSEALDIQPAVSYILYAT